MRMPTWKPQNEITPRNRAYEHWEVIIWQKRKQSMITATGIPQHEMEALARVLLPEIEKFYASEEGQRLFAQWKEEQQSLAMVG